MATVDLDDIQSNFLTELDNLLYDFYFQEIEAVDDEITYIRNVEGSRYKIIIFSSIKESTSDFVRSKKTENAIRTVLYDPEKERLVGKTAKVYYKNNWQKSVEKVINRYIDMLEKEYYKKCPECGEIMRWMIDKIDATKTYWACNGYPDCNYTENLEDDHPKRIKIALKAKDKNR